MGGKNDPSRMPAELRRNKGAMTTRGGFPRSAGDKRQRERKGERFAQDYGSGCVKTMSRRKKPPEGLPTRGGVVAADIERAKTFVPLISCILRN